MDRKKVTQQLVDEGKMIVHGGHYFPNSPKNPGTGKFSTLRNMKSSENGVIVMGAAKAGNHLVMSILVKGPKAWFILISLARRGEFPKKKNYNFATPKF